MVYTVQERVELVSLYYQNQNCARAAARIFNQNHLECNVRHKYVIELISKFVETGSVMDKKRAPIGTVNDEGAALAVLGRAHLIPNTQSVRQLRGLANNVFRILHKYKFHPYKMKLIHELNDDDFDRRQEFCEIMAQHINHNPNFLYNVCFSDECTFSLRGDVNRHNCRFWSDTNPHVFRESHTQHPEKLNVWVGILGDNLIGPLFIPGNLNGEIYLDMLENAIDPLITEKLENDPLLLEQQLHFQQDGAPPHYAASVRQYLNLQYPGRWIGRRGPMEWPARSPDLTPLDFFLWGLKFLKLSLRIWTNCANDL